MHAQKLKMTSKDGFKTNIVLKIRNEKKRFPFKNIESKVQFIFTIHNFNDSLTLEVRTKHTSQCFTN